ncbi:MAG: hypothetical protein IT479_16285 [Xanthomonadales bacterium]|nr:hypothetical protein [Xanthomonadales bacterium]MCC6594820.1 hypothetical protein [Xanthomonadales bacterium]MCE7929994.1 hypothetical protein [Xanthomonadales bacterium PRO6]
MYRCIESALVVMALVVAAPLIAAEQQQSEPAEEPVAVDVRGGETMLAPRGRAAYEKHLAELNAKYGAGEDQQALKAAVLSANAAPPPREAGAAVNRVVVPVNVAPGQRLKVELLPHGDRQFLFQDEVYDALSLQDALVGLKRGYVIDQIILLSNAERPIQIDHLLELARIGRDLEVTTAYQQGGELKLISAK